MSMGGGLTVFQLIPNQGPSAATMGPHKAAIITNNSPYQYYGSLSADHTKMYIDGPIYSATSMNQSRLTYVIPDAMGRGRTEMSFTGWINGTWLFSSYSPPNPTSVHLP